MILGTQPSICLVIPASMSVPTRNRIQFKDPGELASKVFADARDRVLAENVLTVIGGATHKFLHWLVRSDERTHVIEHMELGTSIPYKLLANIHAQSDTLVGNVRVLPSLDKAGQCSCKLQVMYVKHSTLTGAEDASAFGSGDVLDPMDSVDARVECYHNGATHHKPIAHPHLPPDISAEQAHVIRWLNHCVHHMSERMPVVMTSVERKADVYRIRFDGLHELDSQFVGFLIRTTANYISKLICECVTPLSAEGHAQLPCLRLTIQVESPMARRQCVYGKPSDTPTIQQSHPGMTDSSSSSALHPTASVSSVVSQLQPVSEVVRIALGIKRPLSRYVEMLADITDAETDTETRHRAKYVCCDPSSTK